jgi:hypothetical protein
MSDIPPSLHAAVVLRAGNLTLACVSGSLRKWAKQTATDPDSGEEVPFSIRGRKTVAIHPPMSW